MCEVNESSEREAKEVVQSVSHSEKGVRNQKKVDLVFRKLLVQKKHNW